MRQLEAQIDAMSLGFAHSSFVLANSQEKIRSLLKSQEDTENRCVDKWVEMKEARASLMTAVEELRKTGQTAAESDPVMRLLERHIGTCENLAGVVSTISDTVIKVVGEVTASTKALAVALGHDELMED